MPTEQTDISDHMESWIDTFRASGFDCDPDLRRRAFTAVYRARDRGASPEAAVAAGLRVLALSVSRP